MAEPGQGLDPAGGPGTPFQPLDGSVETPWCRPQLTSPLQGTSGRCLRLSLETAVGLGTGDEQVS